MARLYFDAVGGALSADLLIGATTMSSAGLADMGEVAAGNEAMIGLFSADADGRILSYEQVKVTAHTAGATTATVTRAQGGTAEQNWSAGATWRHTFVASDSSLFVGGGGGGGAPAHQRIQAGPTNSGSVSPGAVTTVHGLTVTTTASAVILLSSHSLINMPSGTTAGLYQLYDSDNLTILDEFRVHSHSRTRDESASVFATVEKIPGAYTFNVKLANDVGSAASMNTEGARSSLTALEW